MVATKPIKSKGKKAGRTLTFKRALSRALTKIKADGVTDERAQRARLLDEAKQIAANLAESAPPKQERVACVDAVLLEGLPFVREPSNGREFPRWVAVLAASARARHRSLQRTNKALADVEPISASDIYALACQSGFRCAVSGVAFGDEHENLGAIVRFPFRPSIDQRIPGGGYGTDNAMLVCNMTNFAKNQWSAEAVRWFIEQGRLYP